MSHNGSFYDTASLESLASPWDRDQQATAYPNRALVSSREAVIVAWFEEPAEAMLGGGPEHKVQHHLAAE